MGGGLQDLYAFNGHLTRPDDVRPGDILAVGRHHRVQGPCVGYQTRQVVPRPPAAGPWRGRGSCRAAGFASRRVMPSRRVRRRRRWAGGGEPTADRPLSDGSE